MNKRILIIFAGLLIFAACGEKEIRFKYVDAEGGLRMRSIPDLKGEKITTIPNHKKVSILEEKEDTIHISGKSGKWTKISYNGTEGWVFGGFLSDKKFPSVQDNTQTAEENSGCKYANKSLQNFSSGSVGEGCGPDVPIYSFSSDNSAWVDSDCESGSKGNWHINGNKIYVKTVITPVDSAEYGCIMNAVNSGDKERCLDQYRHLDGRITYNYIFELKQDGTLERTGNIERTGNFPTSLNIIKSGELSPINMGCLK